MKLQTFLINMELFFINNKELIIQKETNEHINRNCFKISNSNQYYVYTLSEYFIIYTTKYFTSQSIKYRGYSPNIYGRFIRRNMKGQKNSLDLSQNLYIGSEVCENLRYRRTKITISNFRIKSFHKVSEASVSLKEIIFIIFKIS